MNDTTGWERSGDIAVITLAAPPVNALGQAVRAALARDLDACLADPAVRAILLRARGRCFSAGADIGEFGAPPRDPLVADLCRRIEDAPLPVVCVLQGPALGGGAELALAAHYRLATPAASIGLPEIGLGLVPGGGGTQRLPRLIGAEAALVMMAGGQSLDAVAAAAVGLVDAILPEPGPESSPESSPESGPESGPAAAIAFVRALIDRGLGPRPTLARGEFTARADVWLAAVAAARAGLLPGAITAQHRLPDCVEAALLLPPEAGFAFERAAFELCLASPESAALRHLFRADRRVPQRLGHRGPDGRLALGPEGRWVAARLAAARAAAEAALRRAGAGEDLLARAAAALGLPAPAAPARPQPGAASPADVATAARALLSAVMAGGGRLIDAGAVASAADLDAIAVAGAGWPRLSGGPMHAAQAAGLAGLLAGMEDLARLDPVWTAPQALREAVKSARGFDALSPPAPAAAGPCRR